MTRDPAPVRIGVVGCGVVATAYYLPFLMDYEHAEITAVCDLEPRRTAACMKLFGAKAQYAEYFEMLDKAELDAVLILTAPGTHVKFAMAAIEKGLHFILQKPMALSMADAHRIVDGVRAAGVKAIIEPSSNTLLDPTFRVLRELIDRGVLGDPYWFSWVQTAGTQYTHMLGGNPYGNAAFFAADSGGMLLDFPYTPSEMVTLLGSCKTVTGTAAISVPDRFIVPDTGYTEFLEACTDPHDCNYWSVVADLDKTEPVKMAAPDNVWSSYEMDAGWIGSWHIGRPFHPMFKEAIGNNGLQVFGTEGNLIMGAGHRASIISSRSDLLPHVDSDGWCHLSMADHLYVNYYHASSRHLCECILEDHDPIPNVEWGRHITEMMIGALESSRTGQRYDMTTIPTGMR